MEANRSSRTTVCRELDVAARFTGPDAWLRGHALGHILTALCLGCMDLYYRSERIPAQGEQIEEALNVNAISKP